MRGINTRTFSVWLLTIICSISLLAPANATHLVGGNLGYEYLGPAGADSVNYRIYMQFYLNCDNSSNFETLLDLLQGSYANPVQVGVYREDPAFPNADKQLHTVVDLFLADSALIEPDLPNNCVIGQGLCTKEGLFEATVTLPLDFNGYHLYSHFFARNLAIDNLLNPNGTGIGYYARMSPTPVVNSSPEFLGLPTPFLCVNDTTTFVNSAFDPDGDQLVFSFETPYNSQTFAGGLIAPPAPNLDWPIPPVNYVGGFSTVQPFGAGGYSFINGVTGLTEYMAPNQGNYVVLVEIKEFRNNQLIGITRRDLQIQAIICPPNESPQVSGVLQTSYTVNAGEQLCFNMSFTDVDGDSLFLDASGGIFDPLQFNPPATIAAPDSGLANISSQFCWTPACDAGQAQPYLFSASVTDNGCPPKTTDVVFDITVVPFDGPQQINGPDQVCDGELGQVYSTDSIAGVTYTWQVTGGTIVSGGTGPSITVDWGGSGTGTVSVFGVNTFSCGSDTVQLPITINTIPATDAGADVQLCEGDTAMIGGSPTGPGGSTFSWSPPGDLSNPAAANPNAFPTVTTDYIVSVNNNGCVAQDTVRVEVNAPPNAGQDSVITLCSSSDSLDLFPLLGASADAGGTWTGPVNLPNGFFDPAIDPAGAYTYSLTGIGPCPDDAATVTINVTQAPDAGSDANVPVCGGGVPFNMFNALAGTPDPGGAWFDQSFSAHGNIFDPAVDMSGPYYYVVAGAAPCENDTSILNVSIQVPPADAGPNTSVCIGDTVPLNATGGTQFSWDPPATLTNGNIADPGAFPTSTTTYTVTVTDAQGCVAIDSVEVTVDPLPSVDAGNDTTICEGAMLVIGGSPTGPAGSTYAWDNSALLNDTTLANPTATITQNTTFTVFVVDGNMCANNDQITVQVNPAPAVDAGNDLSICPGDSAQLQGSGGGGLMWSPPGDLSDPNIGDPFASPDVTTTYTLTVTDGNNCTNTDQATVTVLPLPPADAGNDQALCIGDTVQLDGSGGSTYQWSPAPTLSDPAVEDPDAFPTVTTTYYVTVTDANNCSATDSVTVTVNLLPNVDAGVDTAICAGESIDVGGSPTGPAGSTFQWSPVGTLNDPALGNPTATPTGTTVYTVAVMDANNCPGLDSMTVTVNPLPAVDAGPDTALCVGDSLQLMGSGVGSISWDPGATVTDPAILDPFAFPTQTTTYTLSVFDGNSCLNTDDVVITVNTLPTADAGDDAWVCPGFDVQLQASGGANYLWSPAGDLDDPAIADPQASPPVTTTFTVTVFDANGCADTDDVVVTVNDDVPVDAGADASLCFGDSVQLGGNPTSVNGTTYLWSPWFGLNDTTSANPTAQPDTTVLYTLVVTNDTCTNSDQVLVTIQGEADANFTYALDPRCDGFRVHFINQSTGATEYLWNFGDGTTSTEEEPVHEFPYGQQIVITLSITDQFGCTGSITMDITPTPNNFDEYVSIIIPNVFTPNGDGDNDVFTPFSNAALGSCTTMRVFNRWGQRVFVTSGNNITWDGRNFAGEVCNEGTYFYEILVNDMPMKGSVNLSR